MVSTSNPQRRSTKCECISCTRAHRMITLLSATLAKPYAHGDYYRIGQLERMLRAVRKYEEND